MLLFLLCRHGPQREIDLHAQVLQLCLAWGRRPPQRLVAGWCSGPSSMVPPSRVPPVVVRRAVVTEHLPAPIAGAKTPLDSTVTAREMSSFHTISRLDLMLFLPSSMDSTCCSGFSRCFTPCFTAACPASLSVPLTMDFLGLAFCFSLPVLSSCPIDCGPNFVWLSQDGYDDVAPGFATPIHA